MGLRILVVDDDLLIVRYTIDTLTLLGHTAQEANSVPAAMAVINAGDALDLVLTDLHMGQASGYDLAQQINQSRPELPIVVITADDLATDDPHTMPVLLKPYTRAELVKAIDAAMTSAGG